MQDYQGTSIRLSEERREHILRRPEMAGLDRSIDETLKSPDSVIQSLSDAEARLYYRY